MGSDRIGSDRIGSDRTGNTNLDKRYSRQKHLRLLCPLQSNDSTLDILSRRGGAIS